MELILQERSSKGMVKDYFTSSTPSTSKGYRDSPFLYKTLMDMVKADPILFSAISLTVDLATHKGYTFIGENQREIKRALKIFNDKLDFDQVIDNILWQLLIYGDAFLEVRWNLDKTDVQEIHPLETSQMRINYTEHGDIIGFQQVVDGVTEKDYPSFSKDEIVFFRQFWIGSQVYSQAPFESISRSYATKVYANDYLQTIFRHLPPKMIYFLKSANEAQKKALIENVIRAKTNPNLDIFAQGEAFEAKALSVTFDNGLMNVLEFLRKEVLTITRVPPHWVGIMDGANRGIGENVVIPYETKIKKIQQKVESQINKDLLPKLGLNNIKFKWNSITLMDEKTVIEIMNFLKAQGFDSETIIDYARERGVSLRDGAYIEDKMQFGQDGSPTDPDQVLRNKASISRMGENKKTDRLTNTIDKKGVSKEGGIKLEQNKVI